MYTKPHLTQIQSSNSLKYENLLEEVMDINSNIEKLDSLGINAILDTFRELESVEKDLGFYMVRSDETYRNNSTHYYYDGSVLKMVGGELQEGILKKTVVFYIKNYTIKGQEMKLHVPYKGYISGITLTTFEDNPVKFNLWADGELIDEFNSETSFMEWDVYFEVNNPDLSLEVVGDEVGVENININVDIVLE